MTPRERAEWMEAVLADRNLADVDKVVGIRLGLHLNLETGRCDPSVVGLAERTASSVRAVYRALTALRNAGWIERNGEGHGGRTSNQYALRHPVGRTAPAEPASSTLPEVASLPLSTLPSSAGLDDVNPATTGTDAEPNPATSGTATLPLAALKPCQKWHPNKEENQEENRESRVSPPPSIGNDPTSGSSPPPPDHSFGEWWEHYPRKVAKDGARKAYARIVNAGQATPAELLAGVMRYAAERTGQDEKYTKHPTTWLNNGCWADAPLGALAGEAPISDLWTRRPAGQRDIRTMSNLEIAMAGIDWSEDE